VAVQIVKSYYISCDVDAEGCDGSYDVDGAESAWTARLEARDNAGWEYRNRKDICKHCRERASLNGNDRQSTPPATAALPSSLSR